VGWRESDPVLALETSVGWHLTNPPTEQDWDFTADDIALERRSDTDSSSRSEAERDAT
jgi:hypothetical protein